MPQSSQVSSTHVVEDVGYRRDLNSRQIRMIAIGGAIGTGLFMGAGARLASSGPALVLVYAVCGVVAFLILRALGELITHRPTAGSFVSYAREFYGEAAAYTVGWLYWFNWAAVAVVDVTAAALYLNFFARYVPILGAVPQWLFALIALGVVVGVNLISVKVFGELEFWFALVKVAALVVFLVVGTAIVVFGVPGSDRDVGFALIAANGGPLPHGVLPALITIQGVIFAYGSIELLGTAAGETRDPATVMPKAINTVILRIAVFYVGSVLLLALLLPYTAYRAGESPFVTFFSSVGVRGADAVMNLVVLTAALSSLNAGLYSTGRIIRSMALAGSAPHFGLRMSASGVPYAGIVLTGAVALLGVGLNAVVPSEAFEIVLNISALCLVATWAAIMACQLRLWRRSTQGRLVRPAFRMPGTPWTGITVLAFLAGVVALMALDYPVGTTTVASSLLAVPVLAVGWRLVGARVRRIASGESAPQPSPSSPAPSEGQGGQESGDT